MIQSSKEVVQDTLMSQQDEHIRFISFEKATNDGNITVDAEDVESLNNAGMYYYSNREYEYAATLFYAGTLLDGKTEDAKQLAFLQLQPGLYYFAAVWHR